MKLQTLALVFTLLYSPSCSAEAFGSDAATYVQGLQRADGGFCFNEKTSKEESGSTVSATSAAIRALKYFDGKIQNRDACRKFVDSCFDEDSGGFADRPGGKVTLNSSSLGLIAASDLHMETKKYKRITLSYLAREAKTFEDVRIAAAAFESVHELPPLGSKWLQNIEILKNSDGSYGEADGKTRQTASALVTELRLGQTIENRKEILKIIREGQRTDGGFGKENVPNSDLESCYRVMRAFHMLGEKPDCNAMRRFIDTCKNSDGAYSFSPGQKSNVVATYFAGIILHWMRRSS